MQSPGGGGYGPPGEDADEDENEAPHKRRRTEPMDSQKFMETGSVHAYRMAQESA